MQRSVSNTTNLIKVNQEYSKSSKTEEEKKGRTKIKTYICSNKYILFQRQNQGNQKCAQK